jgi:predicted ATPase
MALHSIHVQGFKSIRDQTLELSPLNVFIGSNGAGKSNLIAVFGFLSSVTKRQLSLYTGQAGGANSILHFGRKRTARLSIDLDFRDDPDHANIYETKFVPTEADGLVFEGEATYFWHVPAYPRPYLAENWSGHSEAEIANSKDRVARHVMRYLESYRVYHFHDTSPEAPPKQTCDVGDNRFLRSDASNLAAFLYFLQEQHHDCYQNIEDSVRQIAPFFKRFKLAPTSLNPEKIRVEWEDIGSDTYFNASAFSDGTLRFICLSTLLLQPDPPPVILIDEPELGLHPAAVQMLAAMLQSASIRSQLLVSTQSVTLINHLDPSHVWIVERENGESEFKHLKQADMSAWLEEYSLGELWEKNLLGGRP